MNEPLGSPAHQALIAHVVAHYAGDDRIRAVAVFGSADPAAALATVLAEVQADYDLGPQRRALLVEA